MWLVYLIFVGGHSLFSKGHRRVPILERVKTWKVAFPRKSSGWITELRSEEEMDSWLPGHGGIERSILGTEMDGALSVAQGPAPLVRALVAQWRLGGCWT